MVAVGWASAAGGGVLGLGCDEFDVGATELVAGVVLVPEPGRLDGALSVPVLDPGRLHTSVSVGDSIPERCVGGVGDGQLIGGDGETLLESLAVLARAIVGVPRFIELSSGVCPQTVEPDRRFASHPPLPTGSGCRLLSTGAERSLRGEGTALGGGGDVGAVGGEDRLRGRRGLRRCRGCR